MNHRAQLKPIRRFLNDYPQVIAYALVVLTVFFTIWLDNENSNSDEKQRCISGVDTRNVDRDQTERIYYLALSFVPKDLNTLNPSERKQVKAYVNQVSDFRTESFKTIKPSTVCLPFVNDAHVTPQDWEKSHPPKPLQATKENR